MGRVFLAHGTPLMAVSSFCYLGRTVLSANNDWLAVELKLRRARVNGDGWRRSWKGKEQIRERRVFFMW